MTTRTTTEPVPPAKRRSVVGWVVLAALLGVSAGGVGMWFMRAPRGPADAGATAAVTKAPEPEAEVWQCPMHPAVTQDHPGDCPICGMKLIKVSKGGPVDAGGARTIAYYRSPMNPAQTSHEPKKDEMGMDYVPVYTDEIGGDAPTVKGLAVVAIDAARQQMIGLRTAKVTLGPLGEQWRTVGRVAMDPTRVRAVNVKVEGYVERIFVDFVGRPVRRGEPLFSLYSPALLSAQSEYLLALKTRQDLAKGGALVDYGEALVTAARHKLELWDVPAAEIERLERTREPTRTLTFVSPIGGVVTSKKVVEGTRLMPGDSPYEITDLSMVWVMADAYESDLGRVKVGMKATLSLPAYANRVFTGDVAFIDPLLDAATRTAKVHLHFPNPGGELKPEMFGEVTLAMPPRDGLRAPADAIVHSGTRDVVFVSLGDGRFQPREVRVGVRMNDTVEIVDGLRDGEEVVTRANFLIDSESQLRASLAALGGK